MFTQNLKTGEIGEKKGGGGKKLHKKFYDPDVI